MCDVQDKRIGSYVGCGLVSEGCIILHQARVVATLMCWDTEGHLMNGREMFHASLVPISNGTSVRGTRESSRKCVWA